jgi:hypothetical protein
MFVVGASLSSTIEFSELELFEIARHIVLEVWFHMIHDGKLLPILVGLVGKSTYWLGDASTQSEAQMAHSRVLRVCGSKGNAVQ